MQNELFVEGCKPVWAAAPIDITGAGLSGDWVHLQGYRKCAVVLQTGAWAGGTAAVTLNQATDNAGTGSKAVAFTSYYLATGLTSDVLTKTAVVSNTFNLSAANKLAIIEVWAADLDVSGGFGWLQVAVASPGANSDLVSALYVLYQGGYTGKPENAPVVIS